MLLNIASLSQGDVDMFVCNEDTHLMEDNEEAIFPLDG